MDCDRQHRHPDDRRGCRPDAALLSAHCQSLDGDDPAGYLRAAVCGRTPDPMPVERPSVPILHHPNLDHPGSDPGNSQLRWTARLLRDAASAAVHPGHVALDAQGRQNLGGLFRLHVSGQHDPLLSH